MYVTYTDDDRMIVSNKRLTKKQVENLKAKGIEFPDNYDNIAFEIFNDFVLVSLHAHICVEEP